MPKVLHYTPPWLSRPSAGFELFSSSRGDASKNKSPSSFTNPLASSSQLPSSSKLPRTIVNRGTEIFAVVDNQIRWSDLRRLSRDGASLFKTLKVPISSEIIQLSISPADNYMAIVTSHTVHVAVLPDPDLLDSRDVGPFRIKTFHLGPTAHVLENSSLASVLWHPLGFQGRCLVTVTEDAIVRLWEVNKDDRWSFDQPTLGLDLKAFESATSDEDVLAAASGVGKGFSPDFLEMEVASACFGGSGAVSTDCWAPFALWVAMKAGDIYALSPLLPQKWTPTPGLLESLSISIAAARESTPKTSLDDYSADEALHDRNIQIAQQQRWLSDISEQEPFSVRSYSSNSSIECYRRPSALGSIPLLQGPYNFELDIEDGDELADLLVIEAHSDYLLSGEIDAGNDELYSAEADGILSVGIVCVLTQGGKMHVCLDIDGVEGQWPQSELPDPQFTNNPENSKLLPIETVELARANEDRPSPFSFTSNPRSRYLFYVNSAPEIFSLSFSPWIKALQGEIESSATVGSDFRVNVFLQEPGTKVQSILTTPSLPTRLSLESLPSGPNFVSCVAFEAEELGHLVLTAAEGIPYAVALDYETLGIPYGSSDPSSFGDGLFTATGQPTDPVKIEPRPAYQPAQVFWASSRLSEHVSRKVTSKPRRWYEEEIRLSPAVLELMTDTHRVLSEETHMLGLAAADLFRRCDRLREEFRGQIRQVSALSDRIDNAIDEPASEGEEKANDDNDGGDDRDGGIFSNERQKRKAVANESEGARFTHTKLDLRLSRVRARQSALESRIEKITRRASKLGNRPLSERELEWVAEANRLSANFSTSVAGSSRGSVQREKQAEDDIDDDDDDDNDDNNNDDTSPAAASLQHNSSDSDDDGRHEGDRPADRRSEWQRFQEVCQLKAQLVDLADQAIAATKAPGSRKKRGSSAAASSISASPRSSPRVPAELRKSKLATVNTLLERETALVEATAERLGRLQELVS